MILLVGVKRTVAGHVEAPSDFVYQTAKYSMYIKLTSISTLYNFMIV